MITAQCIARINELAKKAVKQDLLITSVLSRLNSAAVILSILKVRLKSSLTRLKLLTMATNAGAAVMTSIKF